MTALREFIKVKNRQVILDLPIGFDYENVEVVVMPVKDEEWDYWSEDEIKNFGKYSAGLSSNDFEDDDEDYSKW